MAPLTNIKDVLAAISPGQSPRVEEALSRFVSLSEEERKEALPSTIETTFPLVFGENASIESSEDFETLKNKPWSTNCWLSPKAILSPTSPEEVSKILTLIKFLGATFSIRGGGHLQNPGFTSNNGGVVINLSNLNKITVSEDKTTAKIGAGLTWIEVYKELDPHGVSVTGARMPPVGVSGSLLGGGLSFQNSEYGFSSNGVVDYEIVLADSRIVHANAKENLDLFWVLKAGGPNFGIVTKFEMSTVPNQGWAEARLYSPKYNLELIEALVTYHEVIETDNKATLIFQATSRGTVLVFFYSALVESPEAFKCFYDVPFEQKLIEPGHRTVFEATQGIANILPPGSFSHDMRSTTSLPDLEMYRVMENTRGQQHAVLESAGVENGIIDFVLQPIASSAIKACDSKGGNPLGLKAQGHTWVVVMGEWKNPKDEERVRNAVRTIVDKGEEMSKKNGTYLPFQYANYSSRDQSPLASYGVENLARLKAIALKYDPEQVFQLLQNGGFLVSRA